MLLVHVILLRLGIETLILSTIRSLVIIEASLMMLIDRVVRSALSAKLKHLHHLIYRLLPILLLLTKALIIWLNLVSRWLERVHVDSLLLTGLMSQSLLRSFITVVIHSKIKWRLELVCNLLWEPTRLRVWLHNDFFFTIWIIAFIELFWFCNNFILFEFQILIIVLRFSQLILVELLILFVDSNQEGVHLSASILILFLIFWADA